MKTPTLASGLCMHMHRFEQACTCTYMREKNKRTRNEVSLFFIIMLKCIIIIITIIIIIIIINFVLVFETGFLCVDQASLELRSLCFCLLSTTGIKGMH